MLIVHLINKRCIGGACLAVLGIALIGCVMAGRATPVAPTTEPQRAAEVSTAAPPASAPTAGAPCALGPFVAPTPPATVPGYAELDPATGLHVTGELQVVDLDTYRLRLTGLVERELALTLDDMRCMPRAQTTADLICPGFFEDRATWAGVPIREVLALARPGPGARTVEFVSADEWVTTLPLTRALEPENLLAYEWEGQPLPRLHGFPLRVVLPQGTGGDWAKWVMEIRITG